MMRIPVLALLATFSLTLGCAKNTAETVEEKPTEEKAAPAEMPASMPSAAATPTKGENPGDRNQADDDGVVRRGAAITPDLTAMSVEATVAKAEELKGKHVKVTGKVAQVCAKKGCWWAITDDTGTVMRITAEGYKFFVPTDAVGMSAVVEGKIDVKVLDVATAQHYEDDAVVGTGKKAKQITEPQKSVSIAAVALEMVKSPAKDGETAPAKAPAKDSEKKSDG